MKICLSCSLSYDEAFMICPHCYSAMYTIVNHKDSELEDIETVPPSAETHRFETEIK